MKIDEFDRGHLQALNQVLSESRMSCHKNCNDCIAKGTTCDTFNKVRKILDLYEIDKGITLEYNNYKKGVKNEKIN